MVTSLLIALATNAVVATILGAVLLAGLKARLDATARALNQAHDARLAALEAEMRRREAVLGPVSQRQGAKILELFEAVGETIATWDDLFVALSGMVTERARSAGRCVSDAKRALGRVEQVLRTGEIYFEAEFHGRCRELMAAANDVLDPFLAATELDALTDVYFDDAPDLGVLETLKTEVLYEFRNLGLAPERFETA